MKTRLSQRVLYQLRPFWPKGRIPLPEASELPQESGWEDFQKAKQEQQQCLPTPASKTPKN